MQQNNIIKFLRKFVVRTKPKRLYVQISKGHDSSSKMFHDDNALPSSFQRILQNPFPISNEGKELGQKNSY